MQSHFRRAQSKRSLLAGTTKSDETTWEVTQVAESQGASEGPLAAPCLPSVRVSGTACSQAPQAAGLCPYSLQPQPPPPPTCSLSQYSSFLTPPGTFLGQASLSLLCAPDRSAQVGALPFSYIPAPRGRAGLPPAHWPAAAAGRSPGVGRG